MKIRTGFVSNSSSSSFAICMAKGDYETALTELPQDIQDYIKFHCNPPQTKEFGEIEIVLVSGMYGDATYFNGYKEGEFIPRPKTDYDDDEFSRHNAIRCVMKVLRSKPHLYDEQGA